MTDHNELVERLRGMAETAREADFDMHAATIEEAIAALEAADTIQTRIEDGRPAVGGQPAGQASPGAPARPFSAVHENGASGSPPFGDHQAQREALVSIAADARRSAEDSGCANCNVFANRARQALTASPPTPQVDAGEVLRVLRSYIYETTHLSPQCAEGFHECRISNATLRAARSLADKLGREG